MINEYIRYKNINGDERYGIVLDKIEHIRDYSGHTNSYLVGIVEEFYDYDISERENSLKDNDYNTDGYDVQLISPSHINKYFQSYSSMCKYYYRK